MLLRINVGSESKMGVESNPQYKCKRPSIRGDQVAAQGDVKMSGRLL